MMEKVDKEGSRKIFDPQTVKDQQRKDRTDKARKK